LAVVTSQADEPRFLAGFAAGASDVVPSDCAPDVFVARLRAVFRRVGDLPAEPDRAIEIGEVRAEPRTERVFVRGSAVHLTRLEFALLVTLMRDAGVVYSRKDLLDSVWGTRDVALERTVDAHIWKVRRKLAMNAASPAYIVSVPRLGYRFRRTEECVGATSARRLPPLSTWRLPVLSGTR